jgi:hypothetical protein
LSEPDPLIGGSIPDTKDLYGTFFFGFPAGKKIVPDPSS